MDKKLQAPPAGLCGTVSGKGLFDENNTSKDFHGCRRYNRAFAWRIANALSATVHADFQEIPMIVDPTQTDDAQAAAQAEAQSAAASGAKPARWALLSAEAAQEAAALGGEMGDLIESAQLRWEDEAGKTVLFALEEMSTAQGVLALAIEAESQDMIEIEDKASGKIRFEMTMKMQPQWAVFLADREAGLVFAFLASRVGEDASLRAGVESPQKLGRFFAMRVSDGQEPFDSLRGVSQIDGGAQALRELVSAIQEHGSLGFARAAWEAETMRSELGLDADSAEGAQGAGGANRKAAPRL